MRQILAGLPETSRSDQGPLAPAFPDHVHRCLQSIAERQVIPRLTQALADPDMPLPAASCADKADGSRVDDKIVDLLAKQLAAGDRVGCVNLVQHLITRRSRTGYPLLEALSASASRLKHLLAQDAIGAGEASVASCTLQFLLQHVAQHVCQANTRADESRRALLIAPEQAMDALDVFDLRLCSEFFRRDGWDVQLERDMTSESFRRVIGTEWFDIVQVFATARSDLEAAANGIRMLRDLGRNPDVGVIVCGDLFRQRSELVRSIGADRHAADASTSVSQARDLHATAERRRPQPAPLI